MLVDGGEKGATDDVRSLVSKVNVVLEDRFDRVVARHLAGSHFFMQLVHYVAHRYNADCLDAGQLVSLRIRRFSQSH